MKPGSSEADIEDTLSDGPQLKPTKFAQLMAELRPLAQVLGRTL